MIHNSYFNQSYRSSYSVYNVDVIRKQELEIEDYFNKVADGNLNYLTTEIIINNLKILILGHRQLYDRFYFDDFHQPCRFNEDNSYLVFVNKKLTEFTDKVALNYQQIFATNQRIASKYLEERISILYELVHGEKSPIKFFGLQHKPVYSLSEIHNQLQISFFSSQQQANLEKLIKCRSIISQRPKITRSTDLNVFNPFRDSCDEFTNPAQENHISFTNSSDGESIIGDLKKDDKELQSLDQLITPDVVKNHQSSIFQRSEIAKSNDLNDFNDFCDVRDDLANQPQNNPIFSENSLESESIIGDSKKNDEESQSFNQDIVHKARETHQFFLEKSEITENKEIQISEQLNCNKISFRFIDPSDVEKKIFQYNYSDQEIQLESHEDKDDYSKDDSDVGDDQSFKSENQDYAQENQLLQKIDQKTHNQQESEIQGPSLCNDDKYFAGSGLCNSRPVESDELLIGEHNKEVVLNLPTYFSNQNIAFISSVDGDSKKTALGSESNISLIESDLQNQDSAAGKSGLLNLSQEKIKKDSQKLSTSAQLVFSGSPGQSCVDEEPQFSGSFRGFGSIRLSGSSSQQKENLSSPRKFPSQLGRRANSCFQQ